MAKHVLWLLVALCAQTAVPSPPDPPADRPAPRVDANSFIAHGELLEKRTMGRIDVYFLGDSIVRRWGATDYPEFLANWNANFFGWNAANFGWGADGIEHILWRLQNGELDDVHPKVIVILAGTNNVGKEPGGEPKIANITRGMQALLDACRRKAPKATIVLTAIFPRNDSMAVVAEINRINENLAQLARQTGVRFLNINPQFADAGGRLLPDIMVDGLHPSLKGYQIWADALKPLLTEILGPPAKEDHAPPPTGDPSARHRREGRLVAPLPFHAWAPTPPIGWNSWDSFGTTVTEAQTKQQADFMAARLKSHGWQYIVVDIQWYEPGAQDHTYRPNAPLTMDAFGRLTPAINRFPSAAAGAGFKPLADHVHGLGLKFGIHLMRGIPRLAVEQRLPVKGTRFTAADIANRNSICPWNPDMYGVDMSKPGAQEYYDSVYELLASWGVDYVKVDDIARPYHEHQREIEAIRRAIDRTGRPMVLSLSPGETPLDAAAHVQQHANLWRISDDFWDRWLALYEQFARLEKWNRHRVSGAWPDADMLPFGVLDLGRRTTRFTHDEQRTVMTLWAIARSPLMHGGDLTKTDDFTLALLTNDEVLAVNQRSTNNRPLFNRDELIVWAADVPGSPDKYVAVFNARDRVRITPEQARYRSDRVTADPASAAAIDLDIPGATRLILFVDPADDGAGDHALWIEPTLRFADGRTQRLTDLKWRHADALWDNVSTARAPGGKAMMFRGKAVTSGIGTLSASKIEYALPSGVVRFRATGAIDENAPQHTRGSAVRFVVAVGTRQTDTGPAGMRVPVPLSELGMSGPVRVRDLWTHRDLGTVSGEFAPEIPFHGAGLYRLSPSR